MIILLVLVGLNYLKLILVQDLIFTYSLKIKFIIKLIYYENYFRYFFMN